MKAFVIIKTGSTFPSVQECFGDFEDWMRDRCSLSSDEVQVINVSMGEALPSVQGRNSDSAVRRR